MIESVLAFRCFGEFAWPPLPNAVSAETRPGVVEIHYIRERSGKKPRACMRWLPRSATPSDTVPPLDPTTPINDLYEIDEQKLKDILGNGDAPFTLVFGRGQGTDIAAARLIFQGIDLFEQFALVRSSTDQAPSQPVLRLPIVRQQKMARVGDAPPTAWSALLIGQTQSSTYRFDIAIAVLRRVLTPNRSSLDGVFPFSLLFRGQYQPDDEEIAHGARAHTITIGQRGRASDPIGQGILGRFDFAINEGLDKRDTVKVPKSDWFWEADASAILSEVFGRSGDNPRAIIARPIITDFAGLPAFPSLGIARDEDGLGFSIVQRWALAAGPRRSPLARLLNGVGLGAEDKDTMAAALPGAGIRRREDAMDIRPDVSEGHWITLGSRCYAVAKLTGHIDLWRKTSGSLKASLTLGTRETFSRTSPAPRLTADGQLDGAALSALFMHGSAATSRVHDALIDLAPDQPQSVLPSLRLAQSTLDRHVGLFATAPVSRSDLGTLSIDLSEGPIRYHASLMAPHRLGPIASDDDRDLDFALPFDASWPQFYRYMDPALAKSRLLFSYRDRHADDDDHVLTAEFHEPKRSTDEPWASLGGLRLRRAARAHLAYGDQSASSIRIGVPRLHPRKETPLPTLVMTTRFDLGAAQAIAVDIARGDRSARQRELIYAETPQTGGRYVLIATDTIGGGRSRQLTARLLELNETPATRTSSVLLGISLFSAKRAYFTPLGSRGSQETAEVAIYDSDLGVWLFRAATGHYHYVHQAQLRGESMDKPGRLEIHDAPIGTNENGLMRPLPLPTEDWAIGLRSRAVEVRFTPPVDLYVSASDVERNYLPPETAGHEIFTQRGTTGVGSALVLLRMEANYGLSAVIEPAREPMPARAARVAEIEALMGRLPGQLASIDSHASRRWGELKRAIESRAEHLSIYANHQESEVQFAPAIFSQAIFALRATALHRPPTDKLERDIPVETAPRQVSPRSPRLHPLGLSGGAIWPIESSNVLNLLLNEPDAMGGTISNIALSPLGGDADQSVKFANGRITIISEMRHGLIQRQKVEVVGRIGALWNRAKHVIVYARTVAPSAQFTPEGPSAQSRSRRAVLRKVSEYVEILEPERRFPDFPDTAVFQAAFLNAARFNGRIIPVDSSWGEDVGTIGWQVPLWNRHAALMRPQVYPRPDMCFVTAAEGEGADAEIAQACLNPENLYFFANTEPGVTDRSDSWPPVAHIDYSPLGPPSPKDAVTHGPPGHTGEAGDIPLGLSRFTWRLGPAASRTLVNAGRGVRPVYAALRTITFMRAQARTDATADPKQVEYGAALDGVRTLVGTPFAPSIGRWSKGEALQHGPGALQTIAQNLTIISEASWEDSDADQGVMEKLVDTMVETQRAIVGLRSDSDVKGAFETPAAVVSSLTAISFDPAEQIDKCKELGDNLLASLTARTSQIRRELNEGRAVVERAMSEARKANTRPHFLEDREYLKAYVEKVIADAISVAFAGSVPTFGKLRHSIETARAIVADCDADVAASIERAIRECDEIAATIDQNKPWSEARVNALQAQLTISVNKVSATLMQTVVDARGRLNGELDALASKIAIAASHALADLTAANGAVSAQIKSAQRAFTHLSDAFAKIDRLASGPDGKLEPAREKLAEWIANNPDKADAAKPVLETLDGLIATFKTAKGHAAALPRKVDAFAERVDATVKAQFSLLADEIGTLEELSLTLIDKVEGDLSAVDKAVVDTIKDAAQSTSAFVERTFAWLLETIASTPLDRWSDIALSQARSAMKDALQRAKTVLRKTRSVIDEVVSEIDAAVTDVEKLLKPDDLGDRISKAMMDKTSFGDWLAALPDALFRPAAGDDTDLTAALDLIEDRFDAYVERIDTLIGAPAALAEQLDDLKQQICAAQDKVLGALANLKDDILSTADKRLEELEAKIKDTFSDFVGLDEPAIRKALATADSFKLMVHQFSHVGEDVRQFTNKAGQVREMAEAYGQRVTDAVAAVFDDGIRAAPNAILRAMAAVGSPPDFPNFDYERDRLNLYLGMVDSYIDTSRIEAYFGRLGEALKAMGITLNVNRIENFIKEMDPSQIDIGKLFPNFGGFNLAKMFKGVKVPNSVTEPVRISGEIDRKAYHGWIQIDVDLPIEGRSTLFSIGPFKLDVLRAHLSGFVRLEASKDTAEMERKGQATFRADFDCVVAGQSMVTLREVAVTYSEGAGLKVDFDPSKIKLNPSLEFIQKSLGSLMPDEVGGVALIKQDGIPIGIEHVFSMPPISLMGVTSGIQNIAIANRFRLIAYPDFILSNLFELSRPDCPFIFSIFILGGTGYVSVNVTYRPFTDELTVIVDAAIGGSASIGFAFAGCTGTLFITLSGVLTYRHESNGQGGGLGISVALLIAGIINVLGIANASLSQLLTISYHDDGGMDARGVFKATVKVTRLLKVTARGPCTYKIKDGDGGKADEQLVVTSSSLAAARSFSNARMAA